MIIGIDPGLSGGIAFLEPAVSVVEGGVDTHPATVWAMPVVTPKARTTYDTERIIDLIRTWSGFRPTAFVEQQHAFPPRFTAGKGLAVAGGSKANWQRGRGDGLFEGILAALQIKRVVVAAISWQNEVLPVRGADTKARSIAGAHRLFPGVSLYPTPKSRKESDGMSDALLIAEFGRRRFAREATR